MAKKTKKKLSEAELVNRASVIASIAVEFMREVPSDRWNDHVVEALGKGRLLFEGALSMAGRTEHVEPDNYLDRLVREVATVTREKVILREENDQLRAAVLKGGRP